MDKHKHYQRGYSLIEVLTASAILSIVAIAAGSFLLSNLFSFNSASNNITLEREGRAALNAITDSIRKGSHVANATFVDAADITGLVPVNKLEFSEISWIEVLDGKLKLDGTTLCNTLGTNGFLVEPLPKGSYFNNCTGLRIKLLLKKENKEYEIESEAYFRNK